MSLEETVQRLSDRVHELEQERSRDQDVINVLRKFDADLLRRVLDLGSQGVLAQDKQLWSAAKGFDKDEAKEKLDLLKADPVKSLLLAGANPNGYKDESGETALHVAAGGYKEALVASLLASKADVNAVSLNGQTPLHKAAEKDWSSSPGIVASLLASKAAVDAVDQEGNAPLHKAAEGGDKGVVASLLASKAAVNAVSLSGETPLDRAKQEEVKALLREHGGQHSLFGTIQNIAEFHRQEAKKAEQRREEEHRMEEQRMRVPQMMQMPMQMPMMGAPMQMPMMGAPMPSFMPMPGQMPMMGAPMQSMMPTMRMPTSDDAAATQAENDAATKQAEKEAEEKAAEEARIKETRIKEARIKEEFEAKVQHMSCLRNLPTIM